MLNDIIAKKKQELKNDAPRKIMNRESPHRSLKAALQNANRPVGLISEVKKASPSKGLFAEQFEPEKIASAYEAAGADAISVLTDQSFFQGSAENLISVKRHVQIPVLRKDFIIDERQITESDAIGADVILLIAAALSPQRLYAFYQRAKQLGLECLVEVHNGDELDRLLDVFVPEIIGINNRDLTTFKTDIQHTEDLLRDVPPESLLISESGIKNNHDIGRLERLGVHGVLVGEALMTSSTPEEGIRNLFGESR